MNMKMMLTRSLALLLLTYAASDDSHSCEATTNSAGGP